MERETIHTDDAPAAIGPYVQAVKANGLVFCSGQIALDPRSGEIVGAGDVAAQTEQVMKNLEAVLTAAGSSFAQVVKTTIFLTDLGDFQTVNAIYASRFEGVSPPARACVEVSALPKGVQVEIEMTALHA
ncbi:MAG TPA: reactive intermediate/imine deaminase [Myxococcales bacterium]|nr:reactive intermediate/imine deaminase [Myxococcales bacterium]